jgi:hypothetical protein
VSFGALVPDISAVGPIRNDNRWNVIDFLERFFSIAGTAYCTSLRFITKQKVCLAESFVKRLAKHIGNEPLRASDRNLCAMLLGHSQRFSNSGLPC